MYLTNFVYFKDCNNYTPHPNRIELDFDIIRHKVIVIQKPADTALKQNNQTSTSHRKEKSSNAGSNEKISKYDWPPQDPEKKTTDRGVPLRIYYDAPSSSDDADNTWLRCKSKSSTTLS